jgi:hypothetical protein
MEVPSFCVLDGNALTTAVSRAMAPIPGERTTLPRPPVTQLGAYRGEGLKLGRPLTNAGWVGQLNRSGLYELVDDPRED